LGFSAIHACDCRLFAAKPTWIARRRRKSSVDLDPYELTVGAALIAGGEMLR